MALWLFLLRLKWRRWSLIYLLSLFHSVLISQKERAIERIVFNAVVKLHCICPRLRALLTYFIPCYMTDWCWFNLPWPANEALGGETRVEVEARWRSVFFFFFFLFCIVSTFEIYTQYQLIWSLFMLSAKTLKTFFSPLIDSCKFYFL